MKRLFILCSVVLLLAALTVWSQPRPNTQILRDGANRGTTTGRPGTTTNRPGTTTTAVRPTVARPTQETCACVTFASIEHPITVGSLARHVALGGGGYGMGNDTYTYVGNPFIVDSYSYFTNPAYADRFRDAVFANFGSVGNPNISTLGSGGQPLNNFGGQSFGAIFSLSRRTTIHGAVAFEAFPGITALNTNAASVMAAYELARYPGWNPSEQARQAGTPANILPLRARNTFYIGTSVDVGGVVLAGGVSFVASQLSTIASISAINSSPANLTQLGFNLGVLVSTNTASMLDISATLLLPRISLPVPGVTSGTTAVNGTVFGANARYIARLNKTISLIPMVNFYTLTSPATGTMTSFDGGIGMSYQTDKLYLVGGVSLSATSGGNLANTLFPLTSEFIFPRFNLGAEIKTADWLKFRMGYASTTNNRSFKGGGPVSDGTNTSYNNYSLINGGVTLGFGLQFGKFNLDLTTDTEVLRRALGGVGTTSSFGYISATFRL